MRPQAVAVRRALPPTPNLSTLDIFAACLPQIEVQARILGSTLRAMQPPEPPPFEGTVIHDVDDMRHVRGLEYAGFKDGREVGRLTVGVGMPPPERLQDGRWGWPSATGRTVEADLFSGLPRRAMSL